MTKTRRDAGRETFWRTTLRRQLRSGLSVRAFCRQEKVAESNFYAWRREIALRDREATTPTDGNAKPERTKPSPAFVPVAVSDGPARGTGIVLERSGGLRVRLPEAIEPDRLAAIVHALEAEAVT